MLSVSVSSFERRLFCLAMAKLGDYLSLYGVLVIRRVAVWFPLCLLVSRGFLYEPGGSSYPARRLIWNFSGSPTNCRNIPAGNPKESVGQKATCFLPHAAVTV